MVGSCSDDVWAAAWEGWGLCEQKGRKVESRKRMCSSKDPVFMQILLLTQREKGKGHQAELARQSHRAAHPRVAALVVWRSEKHQ